MNLLFSNAVLWPLVALVALPVLVHLLARARPAAYRFSSVELILRILRQTARIKKPQDWILLVLRTLFAAAVVLVFLQPVYFPSRRLASPLERKNVVVVIDATASMGCLEGSQTRFAAACAEGADILSGLTARDTANIVWLKAEPESVFPDMGVNLGFLRDALRQARVTQEAGDVAMALRLAVQMLSPAEGRKELYLVSDFQKTAWSRVDEAVPPSVEVMRVPVGREEAPNGALTDILLEPRVPLAGEEFAIHCRVQNFGPQPTRRSVFCSVGESRQSQDVLIPAWGETTASFRHRASTPGPVTIRAVLNEDRFTGDDTRWAVASVRGTLHAVAAPTADPTGKLWLRAVEALGCFTVTQPGSNEWRTAEADAVLLPGLPEIPGSVQGALREGQVVLWWPGPDFTGGVTRVGGFGVEGAHWETAGGRSGVRALKVTAAEDEVFRLFRDGDHGNPAGGSFQARLVFPPDAVRGGEVLMAYDDGVPALVRFRGQGLVYLWNLPLGTGQSDFAGRMEFIPLLAEILMTGRAADSGRAAGEETVPGRRPVWVLDRDAMESDIAWHGPDDAALPFLLERGVQGNRAVARDPVALGLYQWQYGGRTVRYAAANFPVVESDLRTLPPEDVRTGVNAVSLSDGARVRAMREGVPLWPYLLMAALALVMVEGVTLLWVERT